MHWYFYLLDYLPQILVSIVAAPSKPNFCPQYLFNKALPPQVPDDPSVKNNVNNHFIV